MTARGCWGNFGCMAVGAREGVCVGTIIRGHRGAGAQGRAGRGSAQGRSAGGRERDRWGYSGMRAATAASGEGREGRWLCVGVVVVGRGEVVVVGSCGGGTWRHR